MMSESIFNNITKVLEQINEAERAFGLLPGSVLLLAVSKTRSADEIQCAVQAGIKHFGENYLQEALPKIEALSQEDIVWHYIGSIQSNKTRPISEHFDWVHTVSSAKIARRLSEQRPKARGPLNICLQVNIDFESSKSGVLPEELPKLAKEVNQLPNIKLRGLMVIPEKASDFESQRATFHRVYKLYRDLIQAGYALDTLSMGMSGDFKAAIAEGATIIRLGTAIFGSRSVT